MAIAVQKAAGDRTANSASYWTNQKSNTSAIAKAGQAVASFFEKYGNVATEQYHRQNVAQKNAEVVQRLTSANSGSSIASNASRNAGLVADSGISDATPASGSSVASTGVSGDWQSLLQSISDSNNAFNLEQTRMVNEFNAAEAQKNRDWQELMSNTAHQREVKDLIAAGLNPVLSAGGQGAVTGSGAVASGQKAVADNTYAQGMIQMMQSMISAASAENVAKIYANAQMAAAGTHAGAQYYYANKMAEVAGWNNISRLASSAMTSLARILI